MIGGVKKYAGVELKYLEQNEAASISMEDVKIDVVEGAPQSSSNSGLGRVIACNFGFMFLSFAASALMNVLPQLFYAQYAFEHRTLWLSSSLFLSAIFSLIGNQAAQSRSSLISSTITFYSLAFATILLCLVCVSQAAIPVTLYFCCQLVLAFVMACTLLLLDQFQSASAGTQYRHQNDLLTNLFRFIGMLLGPFLFWLYAPGTLMALLGTFVCACSLILSIFSVKAGVKAQQERVLNAIKLSASQVCFLFFAVLVYATYCLLSASLVYLLTDLLGQHANQQAIFLISLIFSAAVGFNVFSLVFSIYWGKKALLFAPMVIFFAGHVLPFLVRQNFFVQLLACLILGIAYGSFMLVLRDVLSQFSIQYQSDRFIAWFNNVPNYGAILGFGLMAAIAITCKLGGFSFGTAVAFCVSACALLQLALIGYFLRKHP